MTKETMVKRHGYSKWPMELAVFMLFIFGNSAHLNIYLSPQEVLRLLGISAEVYYVRDGFVNNYAMNFVVPVPEKIRDISFTWQSQEGHSLPYSINIITSDPEVLPRPTLNVSLIGEIPTQLQTVSVSLKCSGIRSADVDIAINIEVIMNHTQNNIMHLEFRRKKMCLKIAVETMAPPPSGIISLIVGSVFALIIFVILFIIAYCVRGTAKRRNHNEPMHTSSFERLNTNLNCQVAYIVSSTMTEHAITPSNLQNSEELHLRISEITVERCRVRLSKLVQEGTFGRVYKGSYNDSQDVIVKTVAQYASQEQVSLLLKESMLIYGASHSGILSILGVSVEDHTTPFVLYPAVNNMRNLKLYLLDTSCSRAITTNQIVMMGTQLSIALVYLHKVGLVHKDIATRNCVIDDQLRLKLSDNALARDLFPADYNCLGDSENRPLKWMSLEVIQHKQFSPTSDSWAFGVLLWELCTLAKQPYAEVDPFEMENYLKDGYRLAQPFNCPDELFTIMAYCWALLPSERPSSNHLQVCLSEFYSQITRYV